MKKKGILTADLVFEAIKDSFQQIGSSDTISQSCHVCDLFRGDLYHIYHSVGRLFRIQCADQPVVMVYCTFCQFLKRHCRKPWKGASGQSKENTDRDPCQKKGGRERESSSGNKLKKGDVIVCSVGESFLQMEKWSKGLRLWMSRRSQESRRR